MRERESEIESGEKKIENNTEMYAYTVYMSNRKNNRKLKIREIYIDERDVSEPNGNQRELDRGRSE